MKLGNVELHNVAEAREIEGLGGLRLQRCPESVRVCLNERAQQRMLSPAGCEVRFSCESRTATVKLSCPEGSAEAIPFWGPFQGPARYRISAEPTRIELSFPERLEGLGRRACEGLPFSPRVWRLVLRGDAVHYHGVEADDLRLPTPEELPARRYLAYGTSITHGSAATAMHLGYVAQAARRLRADLINLGVGGSAHSEPELATYIAERDDWQFASLALSVNMIGAGFSQEEFTERVAFMVNTVAGADHSRAVACITIYPHFRDLCASQKEADKSEGFRTALRDVVNESPHPNLCLIEGADLLTDIEGLSTDLIHPADNGMIQMGENLARRLEAIIR